MMVKFYRHFMDLRNNYTDIIVDLVQNTIAKGSPVNLHLSRFSNQICNCQIKIKFLIKKNQKYSIQIQYKKVFKIPLKVLYAERFKGRIKY